MSKPKDIDSYIANSSREARPILKEIREVIKSTIPKAEERIWYGVPFYNYHGELAGFAAYKKHISFGFGAGVLQSKDRKMLEEKGYKIGKGTMQIKFDQKVPTTAIKKILKVKAKMNEAKRAIK
ncbi:MAG: iron chaperone [Candidatus Hermodarchaeota archaeon]